MSMPGLLIFRGASGHNPGRVAPDSTLTVSAFSTLSPCPFSPGGVITLSAGDPSLGPVAALHPAPAFGSISVQIAHFAWTACCVSCQGRAWSRHLWREAAPGPVRLA